MSKRNVTTLAAPGGKAVGRLVELGGQVSNPVEERSEGLVFALPKDL